jgi:pSer/pThr/pTyr-binding forkhead associated (FHA) protein
MILGRGRPSGAMPGAEFIDLGSESLGDTVSRSHARVQLVEGRWVLWAMPKSRNLTAVNGSPLGAGEHRGLNNGDRITLGGVSLTLTLAAGVSPG